jgi:hypothetical protein
MPSGNFATKRLPLSSSTISERYSVTVREISISKTCRLSYPTVLRLINPSTRAQRGWKRASTLKRRRNPQLLAESGNLVVRGFEFGDRSNSRPRGGGCFRNFGLNPHPRCGCSEGNRKYVEIPDFTAGWNGDVGSSQSTAAGRVEASWLMSEWFKHRLFGNAQIGEGTRPIISSFY